MSTIVIFEISEEFYFTGAKNLLTPKGIQAMGLEYTGCSFFNPIVNCVMTSIWCHLSYIDLVFIKGIVNI